MARGQIWQNFPKLLRCMALFPSSIRLATMATRAAMMYKVVQGDSACFGSQTPTWRRLRRKPPSCNVRTFVLSKAQHPRGPWAGEGTVTGTLPTKSHQLLSGSRIAASWRCAEHPDPGKPAEDPHKCTYLGDQDDRTTRSLVGTR